MAFMAASQGEMYRNWAIARGTQDIWSRLALGIGTVLEWVLFPTIILTGLSILILSLLAVLTFGLILVVLSLFWWPFLGVLLASSWFWEKSWITRPFLLLPGILAARMAFLFASAIPSMGDQEARAIKAALCTSWPDVLGLSIHVWRIVREGVRSRVGDPILPPR